jgi:hypothetical protein
MLDPQQLVDQIRAFLSGADQTRTDAIADLAAGYAAACRETNDRLRRCGDYLRQGLRSEAIHSAEGHPVLLEFVATLDMPEIDDWEQVCASYDMERPTRMMIEVAQELNEAYPEEQQIHELLVRHRLLAISRAPLQDRLAVVRELAVADPATAFWGEDQEAMERAWLPTFRSKVAAAISENDSAAIQRLATEAEPGLWRTTIPADIIAAIILANEKIKRQEGLVELQALIPPVRDALKSASYADTKKALHRWDKAVSRLKIEVPTDLGDEVAAARQWIADCDQQAAQQDEHDAACQRLWAVLSSNAGSTVLRQMYSDVTASGLSVPDELENEYRRVLKSLDKASRRERLVIQVMVGAAVVVVVAVIGAIIWHSAVH